jgi:hypothetical protein
MDNNEDDTRTRTMTKNDDNKNDDNKKDDNKDDEEKGNDEILPSCWIIACLNSQWNPFLVHFTDILSFQATIRGVFVLGAHTNQNQP